MKKVLIIAGILGLGYWAFGKSNDSSDNSTTTETDTPLTIPEIIAKYQGQIINDSVNNWMYIGKSKIYFESTPYQMLNFLSANPSTKQVRLKYKVWNYEIMHNGPYDGGLWNGQIGI